MAAPIRPIPNNYSIAELETEVHAAPKQPTFVRMKALHKLLRSFDHATMAATFDVSRETLNRWINKLRAV